MPNAIRHSGAYRVRLRLEASCDRVTLQIEYDFGGARVVPGGGLAGFVNRLTALDGELRVSTPASGGAYLEATLPCES